MTTDQLNQLNRLLVTAEECIEMQHDSPALSALAKARRLLGEMLSAQARAVPVGPLTHANPFVIELDDQEPALEEIDRTLPPGFEVREGDRCWYPCKDIGGELCRVFFNDDGCWSTTHTRVTAWCASSGYPTEAAAYADKARWLKAAGVDWPPTKPEPAADPDEPRVIGGLELRPWSIRTKTHWWGPVSQSWIPLHGHVFASGEYASAFAANQQLPTARAAWDEMKKNKEAAR